MKGEKETIFEEIIADIEKSLIGYNMKHHFLFYLDDRFQKQLIVGKELTEDGFGFRDFSITINNIVESDVIFKDVKKGIANLREKGYNITFAYGNPSIN